MDHRDRRGASSQSGRSATRIFAVRGRAVVGASPRLAAQQIPLTDKITRLDGKWARVPERAGEGLGRDLRRAREQWDEAARLTEGDLDPGGQVLQRRLERGVCSAWQVSDSRTPLELLSRAITDYPFTLSKTCSVTP